MFNKFFIANAMKVFTLPIGIINEDRGLSFYLKIRPLLMETKKNTKTHD